MGWISDVSLFAATTAEVAGCTWDPDGTTGSIFLGPIPDQPDKAVGIHTYRAGADSPAHPTSEVRVQFMLRAPSILVLDDMDAALYNTLQGATNQPAGDSVLEQISAWSVIPMGVDDHGRLLRAANYRARLVIPANTLRSW